MIVHQLNCNII